MNLWTQWRKESVRWIESVALTYIHCIYQCKTYISFTYQCEIDIGKQLYSIGSSEVWNGGGERETHKGGNICILIADSCCTTETISKLWNVFPPNKNARIPSLIFSNYCWYQKYEELLFFTGHLKIKVEISEKESKEIFTSWDIP